MKLTDLLPPGRGCSRLLVLAGLLLPASALFAEPMILDFHNDNALTDQWEVVSSGGSVNMEKLYSNQGEPLVRKQGGGDVSVQLIPWEGSNQSVEAAITFRSLPLANAGSVAVWLGEAPDDKVGVLGMVRILESRKVEMRIYPPMTAKEIRTTQPIRVETIEAAREIRRQEYLTLKFAILRGKAPEMLELQLLSAHTGEVFARLSLESPLAPGGNIGFTGVRLAGETFLWKEFSVMAPE